MGWLAAAKQGVRRSASFALVKILISVFAAVTLAGHGAWGSLIILWEVFPSARLTGSWLTDSVLWEGLEM